MPTQATQAQVLEVSRSQPSQNSSRDGNANLFLFFLLNTAKRFIYLKLKLNIRETYVGEIMNDQKKIPRPHGTIKAWEDGHAYFPENIREELMVKKDARVPFFIDSETVLLTRREMTVEELEAELDALKIIIRRRAGHTTESAVKK